MCGITGIWTRSGLTASHEQALVSAVGHIAHRGPDANGTQRYAKAAFGHTRLAIIDTSDRANQPMTDLSGRYCLVFNGEVFNFKELTTHLSSKYGVALRSSSDTEVLLYGLIHEGVAFLPRINGFFAFGFYDSQEHTLLCARDRYGIKPFYVSETHDEVVIGSTLTAVMAFRKKWKLEAKSLRTYLQLSYIPDPLSMIEGIAKLAPGYWLKVSSSGTDRGRWYSISSTEPALQNPSPPHEKFYALMQNAVRRRLLADVPVGTFLSGGLDSSVITLLASRERGDIPAFSIGFPENTYFDESVQARKIAKHLGVKHHLFEVREADIEEELHGILDGFTEPFADSSAILVNMLAKRTRREIKVALSGDGADELLGGYNKHRALLRSLHTGLINSALRTSAPALGLLPASRNHKAFDRMRKMKRYSDGLKLDFDERYLAWASFTPAAVVEALLQPAFASGGTAPEVIDKLKVLDRKDFNTVLLADFSLVLAGDMLCKVDGMSMHRGLEVRVPFLDHEVVDYVFSLPSSEKIDRRGGKKLLRNAFSTDFPQGFFDRNKRGFEAPLRHWMNTALVPEMDRLLEPKLLLEQGIFKPHEVLKLRRRVQGLNPGDAPFTLWAVLVFQHWWESVSSHSTLLK